MKQCWVEAPFERPSFQKIKQRLKIIIGGDAENIVDMLLKRMEQYAIELEERVAIQTRQFMDEKERSERLLGELLPKYEAFNLVDTRIMI